MPIELKGVSYTYMKGTPFEREALRDVSLTIVDGSLTAIAGHTGSGKSTLVQHLNGLLHPTKGKVLVDQGGLRIYTNNAQKTITVVQSIDCTTHPNYERFMLQQMQEIFKCFTINQPSLAKLTSAAKKSSRK